MNILSIQSHVTYGFVGNKAGNFPLQCMGFDVWPVNTVQFSNHTGYPSYTGQIFAASHIQDIIDGLNKNNLLQKCDAILTGYMGSEEICKQAYAVVDQIKKINPNAVYLCDPVIGNTNCYVKPEVLKFFKNSLKADIITPNQFEAETLTGFKITNTESAKKCIKELQKNCSPIVVITGCKLEEYPDLLCTVSLDENNNLFVVKNKEQLSTLPINGTGDLFSALFLGKYLKSKDILKSTEFAIHYLDKVINNTISQKTRELQVLSERYSDPI
jgi:pyridoxine kinase